MLEKKTKGDKLSTAANVKKPVAAKVRPGVIPKGVTKTRKATLSEAVSKTPPRQEAAGIKAQAEAQIDKSKKERKTKLIRDSFKFPEVEYRVFDTLKSRCLAKGYATKKSELVRAGLLVLASLSEEELLKSVAAVEKLKTGRPAG